MMVGCIAALLYRTSTRRVGRLCYRVGRLNREIGSIEARRDFCNRHIFQWMHHIRRDFRQGHRDSGILDDALIWHIMRFFAVVKGVLAP